MNLSNLLSTLDSQIPIAAVDVLSPDEATIIQWLTAGKGRFDESFFVDLPTEPERVQILAIHLQRFGIHLESEYLEAIAANTAKFSGAELETLASEAALLAFDEGRPQQVTLTDLETCRQTITPLAIQDAAAVERMQAWGAIRCLVNLGIQSVHN